MDLYNVYAGSADGHSTRTVLKVSRNPPFGVEKLANVSFPNYVVAIGAVEGTLAWIWAAGEFHGRDNVTLAVLDPIVCV